VTGQTALHQPLSARVLLDQNQRRIDLIAQCANEAKKAEFERKWLTVLQRCAEWFSSLPLSVELYREPGGAFRATVETAFYAMRLAGGRKFGTDLPSEKRRRVEPQYNYAVFLAAVCSRLDEPHRHFGIERVSDRAQWNPSAHGAAGPWLQDGAYRVIRRAAAVPVERMRTGMLAQVLVGSELLGTLDPEVLAELFGAINPNMNPLEAETITHKVVRQAIDVAADFDRKAQRAVFEPVQFAVPSAVHVAGALQPVVAAPSTVATGASPATPVTVPPVATPTQVPAAVQNAVDEAVPVAQASSATSAAATASGHEDANAPVGRSGPRSLLEAIGAEMTEQGAAQPQPAARPATRSADQLGLPFAAADNAAPAAINPADLSSTSAAPRALDDSAFDEVLKGAPKMILELFRALREDVAAGKAKVTWNEKGLAIGKRLIGNYGIASDTLLEHLRKRSLLLANGQAEITLAPRAGELILERTSS
jgi:conjugal transfer pilus assembly protein TraI